MAAVSKLVHRFKLARDYPTALDLEAKLDPRTNETPALQLLARELDRAYRTPDSRLIISIPPQEGKTQLARASVVRHLATHPHTRVVYGSYGTSLARKHGRWVRDNIAANPWLGIQPAYGHQAVDDWRLEGHDGGVLSVGVGAGLTGNPADLVLIDDPVKDREEADSQTYQERVWSWWTDTVSTRLAPGASVVVIMTRWHERDLAGRLLAAEDGHLWRVINIPAIAENDDPLGRQPGEPLQSARGHRDWAAIKRRVGSRGWNALYQGRPAPAEGGMIKRDWWRYYDQPLWVELDNGSRRTLGMDQVLLSADLTFKGTDQSDYVAIGVWGKRGPDAFLLDQDRGHYDFPTTLLRLEAMAARWPDATLKIVEDKANGPAALAMLRQKLSGLVAEIPQGSKVARTAAVSPLIEAGNVHLPHPSLCPWVDDFVEEFAAFPNGAHDDQVDQTTQALNRLLLQPLLTEQADEWTPLAGEYQIINY